jgi:hypothetical protein
MYIQELQDKINEIEDAFETQTPVRNRLKIGDKYLLAIVLYKRLEKYKLNLKRLQDLTF